MSCFRRLCCGGSSGKGKKKEDITVIVVGVDNAGKSTIVSTLRRDTTTVIVPTIGFSEPVVVKSKGLDVRIFDVGGGPRIRGVWDNYFPEVHGIIYVVDSADAKQRAESAQVFTSLLENDHVHMKPILVFANKQDLPGAAPEADISMQLNIAELRTRHSVVKCIADPDKNGGTFDERVHDGLAWLVDAVQADVAALNERVKRDTLAAKEARDARRRAQKAKHEVYMKEKAARAAAAEAGQGGGEQKKAPASDSNMVVCTVCKVREATGRAAVSKWMAICDPCKDALENGRPPPMPDAPASAAAAEPAAAPAPAPAAGGPKCALCNVNAAVRKSGKCGWKPVCDACDPDTAVAAAGAAVDAAQDEAKSAVDSAAATAGAAAAAAEDGVPTVLATAQNGAASAADAATAAASDATAAASDAAGGAQAAAQEALKPHHAAMSSESAGNAAAAGIEGAADHAQQAAQSGLTLPGGLHPAIGSDAVGTAEDAARAAAASATRRAGIGEGSAFV